MDHDSALARYLWRHLARHLAAGADLRRLRDLLVDFGYLEKKLQFLGIEALLSDYDALSPNDELSRLQDTLRRSTHNLLPAWGDHLGMQLAGQLLARSHGAASILKPLLETARRRVPFRPRSARASPGERCLRQTFLGHTDVVVAVALIDSKRAISGSKDKTLRIWDLHSGRTHGVLEGHAATITGVAVIDSQNVISTSGDGMIRLWDLESGSTILNFKGHEKPISSIAMVDSWRALTSSSDNTLRLWDLRRGKIISTFHGHTNDIFAVTMADEKRAVSASIDKTVRIWDVETGRSIRTIQADTYGVQAVARVDAQRFVSGGYDDSIKIWHLETGDLLGTLDIPSSALVFSLIAPDPRHVIAASALDIWIWDIETRELIGGLKGHSGPIRSLASSETTLLSGAHDRSVRVWDLSTLDVPKTVPSRPMESRQDPDLKSRNVGMILNLVPVGTDRVAAMSEYALQTWAVDSGHLISSHGNQWGFELPEGQWGFNGDIFAMGSTPNENYVVAGGRSDHRLWLVSLETGAANPFPECHSEKIFTVALLDEARLISASADRKLCLWDLRRNGELIRWFEGHASAVRDVVPIDRDHVVSASSDAELRVWNLESGETLRTLRGHTGAVHAVAAIDRQHVVSVATDKTIRVWDLSSGRTIADPIVGYTSGYFIDVIDATRVVTGGWRHLAILDWKKSEIVSTFSFDAPVSALVVHQQKGIIIVGDELGQVHFLNLDLDVLAATTTTPSNLINAPTIFAEGPQKKDARNVATFRAPGSAGPRVVFQKSNLAPSPSPMPKA